MNDYKKYFDFLDELDNNGINIDILYILNRFNIEDKELALEQALYVYHIYDMYQDQVDLNLDVLIDVVIDKWADIKETQTEELDEDEGIYMEDIIDEMENRLEEM